MFHVNGKTRKYVGSAHPRQGLGSAVAQDATQETQIVDAFNKVYGVHPGFRANHAKGVVTEGTFTAAPGAAHLSKAVLFNGTSTPVTVRFSDSTGIPNLPDGSPLANPHGMAIKFHLLGGDETNIVINALKFFPVSSGEDFLIDELPARREHGPVTFHLKAQFAAPGDST